MTAPAFQEMVVLVDRDDTPLGVEEKLRVHETAALHRAVSVFVMDEHGRVLLQRRALGKYHSAGLWSNTCCGHPRPDEPAADAAARRLREEMGIACDLTHSFSFIYRADMEHGMTEHELDHVFTGRFSGAASPDPAEVDTWGWMDIASLARETAANPGRYSAWLPIALGELMARTKSG